MSESQYHDARRIWARELVKRFLLRAFDAALVGGQSHVDYLLRLGFDRGRISRGYDAVDNTHFQRGADEARADPEARARLRLPERYFLCSARFVPKKNISLLLEGYRSYRAIVDPPAWDLVVLGDGPVWPEILEVRARLGLEERVLLPGFRQYGELPAYYGLARAFILPSTVEQWGLVVNEAMAAGLPVLVSEVCGSAELVQSGRNGYLFSPGSAASIASTLARIHQDGPRRAAMGALSREIVKLYGPEAFAAGLAEAVRLGEAHRLARRNHASRG
jgi:glycosyltransferase involved in cell wall biosynthesis